jgi:cysteine desulfurase family protein (TIGR01976 family)
MLTIGAIRSHFPALASGAVFFDNPGGTQVAHEVLERIQHYYLHTNANHGGAFKTSQDSDAMVAAARQAVADFLNAARPEEIIFGQNMTSLTLHISRSLARRLQAGDEIVVTRLDHDANVAPWLLIAEDRGCKVRWVNFHTADCTLNMQELEQQINARTRIVAVGYASNMTGTINDVRRIVQLAHSVGAICFIDAVQYAPHRPIDVQELDCDFLACSAYKFFGPHTGILYGKYALLEQLTAYKVRPAGNLPPDKFETGTQSFESIAGVLGALDYLAWVGATFGEEFTSRYQERFDGRKLLLKQAMAAIEHYEYSLSSAVLEGLLAIPGLRIWGITDTQRLQQRVPTFSFSWQGHKPRALAEQLARQQIYVWDGNFYAYEAERYLKLEHEGGVVRVGPVHYNTLEEIQQLMRVLLHM